MLYFDYAKHFFYLFLIKKKKPFYFVFAFVLEKNMIYHVLCSKYKIFPRDLHLDFFGGNPCSTVDISKDYHFVVPHKSIHIL